MKKFDVEITETLQRTVSVEAASQEEAEKIVTKAWNNEDYVLDSADFVGVDSKTALRIPISVGAFKIFCRTAFRWFYKWKMNKIYILKLGSSTKFENLYAKRPF